jgi:hypothetical protein
MSSLLFFVRTIVVCGSNSAHASLTVQFNHVPERGEDGQSDKEIALRR